MFEIKITLPEMSEAINNLAKAISLAVANRNGIAPSAISADNTVAAAKNAEPIAPTHYGAPVPTVSAPANGAPLNATPVPTVAPGVPAVPAAVPAPTAPAANTVPAPKVPTSAPQYTLEMIAKAGTALIDAGKMGEVTALLSKHGVDVLTALDPAQYGTFAAELRAMGAAI